MSYKGYPVRSAGVSAQGTVRAAGLYGTDGKGVNPERAATAVNMIRVDKDRVSKRAGFKPVRPSGGESIGGVFSYYTPELKRCFIVTGDTLTVTDGDYLTVRDAVTLPQSFDGCEAMQVADCMVFMNGSCLFTYCVGDGGTSYITEDGEAGHTGAEKAYVPTVFIGGAPGESAAPATEYEAVNLLTPFVAEQFCGDGRSYAFTIHLDKRGVSTLKAEVLNASGEWESVRIERAADRTVVLVDPPPAPAVAGEDNVRITYFRSGFAASARKAACCTCAAAFGVAGYKDRLFISGNDRFPGSVWYSQMDDPFYIPDLNYVKVGASSTRVLGLCGADTKLAVICRDNVFLLDGSASDATTGAQFTVSQILETPPPSSRPSPCVFDGEAVYLTTRGVAAIAPSGILDERCCVIRSGLINDVMLKNGADGLKMTLCGDCLVISDGQGALYLLDSRRFSRDGRNEGFVWTGVPAKYLWEQDERLYFSDGGAIYGFAKDFRAALPVCDVTESGSAPVEAYWQTPPITLDSFHRIKYFDKLGVRLENGNTGVRVTAYFDGDPARVIYDSGARLCRFGYGAVSYADFTYRPDGDGGSVYLRLHHKRARSVSLRFENRSAGQTFTLAGYSLDYTIM